MGGASLYGLSDTRGLSLLKHGVITVAIQYRLAVFGTNSFLAKFIKLFRICFNWR